jgi:hypothetical protein
MNWAVLSLTLLASGMPGDKGSAAVGLAQETLARELGVATGAFVVQKVEAVEWRDTSLGCPQKGMRYAPVIVPGYRVVLEHKGRAHHFHIGGGRAVRCKPSGRRAAPGPHRSPTGPLGAGEAAYRRP